MLQLLNITKNFPMKAEAALKDINLQISFGDYCVILGSNGSGKSTLLKVISGEYKIGMGKIILNNNDITKQSLQQRSSSISSVNQDINKGTISELSIYENLVLSTMRARSGRLKFYTNKLSVISEQVAKLSLGLEKILNKPMSFLSGGQRQAIATLMALYPKPELLLLDEHTSALDPKSRDKILTFTDGYIKENNITTLMITHNIADAAKYGNRLIIMNHGKIVFDVRDKDKKNLTEQDILTSINKLSTPL
ncbi:MAG: ATP-binding cassette domain-containing protein [Rickettsiales bacterium]|nr:ATP-binding cassette domain-containing protein [Rickettsiales bacterium]